MTYITNLYPDPSCHKQLSTWSNGSGVNVEHIDGHFRYTNTGNNNWSISDWDSWRELMRLGRVVVIAYTATDGVHVGLESGTWLASGTTHSGSTWQAWKINVDKNRSVFCQGSGSLLLEAMAVYEADEWPTVQQLLPPGSRGSTEARCPCSDRR
ncbi:hypothetical protein [Bifidobacterium longum]|uniref:hypothetical protein n=1 Tax=Bifidobacterium longum TaxID=216816 RepID=UPI0021180CD1|nr:hypothetical protein [Bifidobacterium longum]